jgi:sodium/proline symporter
VWKQFGWLGLYEIIPGFILAWLATVVVSRMGPAPSQSILKAHAAVESEFAQIGAR